MNNAEREYSPDEIEALIAEADRLCELERYDEAFVLDLRAAKAGDPRAQTHMGWYYSEGIGTEARADRAFEWYSRAAAQGYPDAQFCLAKCHEEGLGTPRDTDEAMRLYRLAADAEQEDALEALIRLRRQEPAKPEYTPVQLSRMAAEAHRLLSLDNHEEARKLAEVPAMAGIAEAQFVMAECCEENSPEYLRWMRSAAENGYAPAMADYGYAIEESNPAEAFVWYLRAADRAYPRGYYCLACAYDDGIGTEADPTRAAELFRKAYEGGWYAGATQLAYHYRDGEGVAEDPEEAIRLMHLAAEHGEADAQFEYGLMLAEGYGSLDPDIEEGVRWYAKAADGGDSDGMRELARYTLDQPDRNQSHRKALELLQTAVDDENTQAMILLGTCYENGESVKKNDKKAFELYLRAAELEDIDAYFLVGTCYQTGTGTGKDLKKAKYWLEKGVEEDNGFCLDALGHMYLYGEGVREDDEKAFELLSKAYDAGDTGVTYTLAGLYEDGTGTPQDIEKAIELYTEAVDLGVPEAYAMLGYYYETGTRVPRDTDRAIALYRAGIEEHDPYAARRLGIILIYDRGSNRANIDEGLQLLRFAAENDEDTAMSCLGQIYYHGEIVPQDKTLAKKWLQRAVDAGNEDAEEFLDENF